VLNTIVIVIIIVMMIVIMIVIMIMTMMMIVMMIVIAVKTYGCGGVLIASEWVLTAARCPNQTGQIMTIGAYQLGGGYRRICAEYIPHPEYQYFSGFSKNDVALCKLENPVYVDDSKVALRLNDDPAFPNEESLVTIGFGVDHPSATSYAMFLQKAASVAISIEQCKDLFEQVFANETYSAIMDETFEDGGGHICTVYDGLDYSGPCNGDPGGPLVSEQMVPGGKSVHTHVGITSFGFCDKPPDVYARTSHGIGFVKQTICGDFGSPSPFCHEPVVCDDSSEAKLDIQVVSGDHPASVSWTLSKVGAGASGAPPLLSGNNYTKPDFTYGDSICLEKGASYQLLIEENTREDLFYTNLFSLALNGKEIARGVHFGSQEVVDIYVEDPGTPSCDDDPTYIFKKKSNGKTCGKIASLRKKKRRKMCNKKDPKNGDGLVSDFCPSTCKKKCRKKKAKKESTE